MLVTSTGGLIGPAPTPRPEQALSGGDSFELVHSALTSKGGAGPQTSSREVATPDEEPIEDAPEIAGEADEDVIVESDGEDLVDLLGPGDDDGMAEGQAEIAEMPAIRAPSSRDQTLPRSAATTTIESAMPLGRGDAVTQPADDSARLERRGEVHPAARSATDPAPVEARLSQTPPADATETPQIAPTKTAVGVSEPTSGDKRPMMDTVEAGARNSVPPSLPGMGQSTETSAQPAEGSPARRNARGDNATAQQIVEARMPAGEPKPALADSGTRGRTSGGDMPVPAGMTAMVKDGADATVRMSGPDGSAVADTDIDVRVIAPTREASPRVEQKESHAATLTAKALDQGKSSVGIPDSKTVAPLALSQAVPAASRRPVSQTLDNPPAASDSVKTPQPGQSAERSAAVAEPFTALWSARTASAPARSGMTAAFPVEELREKSRFRVADGDPQVSQFSTDLRSTQAPAQVSQTPRPEVPQQVMRQVTEVLHRLSEGGVEIQLRPEELGRVRLQMVPLDQGMTVVVSAERGETLDLMRRHIDQLARALQDLGYSGTQFSFSGGREQRPGSAGAGSEGLASPGAPETETRPATVTRPSPGPGGQASLDIMM